MQRRRSRVQRTEQRHAGDRVKAGAQGEEATSCTTYRTLAAGTRRAARGLRTTRTQGADGARAGRSRIAPRQSPSSRRNSRRRATTRLGHATASHRGVSATTPAPGDAAGHACKLHKVGALGATAVALATVVLPEGTLISIGTCFAPQKKCPGSAFRPAMGKLPIVMRDVSSGLTNSIIRIMIDPSGSKDNGHMWQLAQDTTHKKSIPSRPLTGQIQHVQADNHRIQTDYHGR